MLDLPHHRIGPFVARGQLRYVDPARVKADVEAPRLGLQHRFGRHARVALLVFGTRVIAPRPVRREPQAMRRIVAFHHQNRFRHVQRDQGQARGVGSIVVPGWGCTLAVVIKAVALEHEVMLVPEAVANLDPHLFRHRLMQRVVVGLGPTADQLQCRPVGAPVVRIRGDPRILLQRIGREDAAIPLGNLHPALVQKRPRPARAVVGDHRRVPGLARPPDEQEMVAVALRPHMRLRHVEHLVALKKRVLAERVQQVERHGEPLSVVAAPGAEMRDGAGRVQHGLGIGSPQIGDHDRAADVGRMHARMDCVARGNHAANRDRPFGACRTGVGHDRTRHDRRRSHQQPHGARDILNVLHFIRVFGVDVGVKGQPHLQGQRRRRRGRKVGRQHRAHLGRIKARGACGIGTRQQGRELRAGAVAPIDQRGPGQRGGRVINHHLVHSHAWPRRQGFGDTFVLYPAEVRTQESGGHGGI